VLDRIQAIALGKSARHDARFVGMVATESSSGGSGGMGIVRGARAALVLLLCINLFNYIDRQVLAAVVPEIQKQYLAGDAQADAKTGWLAMAFMLSYMVTSPIFGVLADRWSRWLLVAIGVILWSLASGASGLAGTFGLLLVTRLFVGVGEAAYGPVAPTIISDYYPIEHRGKVLSWFYMAIPVGSALGYTLGGAVASSWSWHWAFFIVVPPGIALGVWAMFMRDPPRGSADGKERGAARHATARDYLILLRTPSYVLNTLAMTAMTFAIGGIGFWMPKYVHDFRGVGTLSSVNMMFGIIVVVAGLSSTLLGGIAGDKLRGRFPGSYFLVSAGGMLCGFPLFLLMLVTPFPYAWIVIFLAVFCLFFNTGPANTALANVTHPSMRATAFAVNIFVIHALGDAISPTVVGMITDRFDHNMNIGFLAVSGMMAIGGVLWWWGARYLGRDTELAMSRL
jgi:MFS family permease